jgi:hypothetical protein
MQRITRLCLCNVHSPRLSALKHTYTYFKQYYRLQTPFILPKYIYNSSLLLTIAWEAKYSKNIDFGSISLKQIQRPKEASEISFL